MSSETKDLDFIIEIEEDEIKAGELGQDDRVDSVVEEDEGFVLTEIEVSNSYFSAEFSTIQPLDNYRSLLILTIRCHPAMDRRFAAATITWKVSAPSSSLNHKPKVTCIAPEHSIGGWTEETSKLAWGIAVPVQAGFAGSSVGLQVSQMREVQKIVEHAMTIVGTRRNKGTRCVWTVEENKSSARGIPSHFQLAMVIEHEGPFSVELDLKASVKGGFRTRYVKAKRGAGLMKSIDVEKLRRGDILWELGEWNKFMNEMTGEVLGATHNFGHK